MEMVAAARLRRAEQRIAAMRPYAQAIRKMTRQAAEAAGAPPSNAGGRYSVLVGSFRHDAEAAVLMEQLRGLGYQARSGRVESEERGVWHQVFVGPYGDIDAARQDEARVRQLPGYADARLTTH